MGAGQLVIDAVSILVLSVVAVTAWFWPKTRSESTLTVMSAVVAACTFMCSRTDASLGVAIPWLLLTLTGGCAARSPLAVADGLIVPGLRRLVARFQVQAADGVQ